MDWEIDLIPKTVDSNTKELKIGLRPKNNSQQKYQSFFITVKSPDNSKNTVKKELQGQKFVYARYPQDFNTTTKKPFAFRGTYTIIWEIDNKFLTCHQFNILPYINDTNK